MNLPREFYAVIAVAIAAAALLLAKAFSLKDTDDKPALPSREEELRAARAGALRQIEILQSPIRSWDRTDLSHEQIARLRAIVAEIDAELEC